MYLSYCRISRDPDDTSESIERQVVDNEAAAKKLGWPAPTHLIDHNRSAWKKTGSRPAFNELIDLIDSGQAEGVVVWNIDRLLRRVDELEILINAVERHPVPIHAATGEVQLDNSDGRYMARILVATAQKSSDDTSRRIKRALADLPPPRRAFVHNAVNHPLVREMADLIIAGEPIYQVKRMLESRGIPTPMGKPLWTRRTIKNVLIHPDVTEALSRSKAAKVKDILMSNASPGPYRPKTEYPLGTLVRCSECDRPMHGQRSYPKGKTPKRRYVCAGGCWSGIDAQHLEDDVNEFVTAHLSRAKPAKKTKRQESSVTVADLIAKLDDRFWLGDGKMNEATYDRIHTELKVRFDAALHRENNTLPANPLEVFQAMSPEQVRRFLPRILDRIDIAKSGGRGNYDGSRVTMHLIER